MANEITGASLQPIYQRLNTAPQYHPLDADTFADWSMEAGDIVTITRDGNSYQSPVHNSVVTWKKGQQVNVSSTGKEKRDSVAKMSQRKYSGRGGGSAGLRNSNYQHIYVEDQYHQMVSGLELTGSAARLYVDDKYRQMRSGLELTSSSAHLYVDNKYKQMQAGLALTSNSAALYVQSRTNRAFIMTRINADGEGEALINADKVSINGQTTINDVMTIADNRVYVKRPMRVEGDILAETLTLRDRSSSSVTLSEIDLEGVIKSASVSGTVLTLIPMRGTPITFNKAVALQGTWSNGTYTVSATSGVISGAAPATTIGLRGVSWNGRDGTVSIGYEDPVSGQWPATGCVFHVTAPDEGYTYRTFRCASAEPAYPGSSTKIFTFTLEGNYSFSAGSNYYFYRTSW